MNTVDGEAREQPTNKEEIEKERPDQTPEAIKTEEDKPVESTVKKDKKESPFLAPEAIKTEEDKPVESTVKRQYDSIDKQASEAQFNAVGKLYFHSKKTGKLETRGEGKFLIIKDKSGMARLIMIRDQLMLKGCDHYIVPASKLVEATKVKNSCTWKALNDNSDAEKREAETQYFATFKDVETFGEFKKKYGEAMEENVKIIEKRAGEGL